MSRYLLSTTEVYRVDSEKEAERLIEEAKDNSKYTLSKYTNQYKEKKQKGEVVDSYYKVSLIKTFEDEKDPYEKYEIYYTTEDEYSEKSYEDYEESDIVIDGGVD